MIRPWLARGLPPGPPKGAREASSKPSASSAGGEVGLVELYDYQQDPGETANIAADHPDVVAELTKRLSAKMNQVVQSSHEP